MDTFMDKLAQRFNAQEMIKANAAAETEEMNRLKAQVQEYHQCLNRMQQICAEMEKSAETAKNKMESAQFQTDSLKEELLAMWKDMQADTAQSVEESRSEELTEQFEDMQDALAAQAAQLTGMQNLMDAGLEKLQNGQSLQIDQIRSAQAEQIENIKNVQAEQLDNFRGMQQYQLESIRGMQQEQLESIKNLQQDQLDSVRSMVKAQITGLKDGQLESVRGAMESQSANMEAQLGEMKTSLESQLGGSNEFVHKECVKVYRNVQAVLIEENNKQVENLEYTLKPTLAKVRTVFTISVAALVVSLAGVVLQVLNILQIF